MTSRPPSARPARIGWDISSATDPNAFDAYREGLADLYATSDFVGGKAAFFNRNLTYQFGGTIFGQGASTGQTFTRSAAEVRRSGFDGISMFLDRAGLVGDVDGKSVSAGPGAVHFRDLTRTAVSKLKHIDLVVTVIPREIAPEWLLDPRMHGHSIDSASPAGRMLAAHLVSTAGIAGDLDHGDGLAAIDAALILAQQAIGAAGLMSPEQAKAAHRTIRQMAIEVIERDLLHPDLSADFVARSLGVSRSTLYRAFEPAGGVMASIQRRRLARAFVRLRLRQGRNPSVAQIAHECGFASESHFSRAFRERYAISPGELGGARKVEAPTQTAVKIDNDVLVDWLRSQ